MTDTPQVAVVMGSDSDLSVMEAAVETLEEIGIPFELRVMSAHRSPELVRSYAAEAERKGLRVIIAAAGGAAHLAGSIAAMTTLPVIGVPIPTSVMGGMDSLLSTIQMPSGVPVATVGLGASGARNAAYLAAQILALGDEKLHATLQKLKSRLPGMVQEKDRKVQQWLKERQATE